MPTKKSKIVPQFKLWLEKEGEALLGKGGAQLLAAIAQTGTLQKAISQIKSDNRGATKMSYRYAWGMLRSIEKRLGAPVVNHARGGANKGGTTLTPLGEALLQRYNRLEQYIEDVLRKDEFIETISPRKDKHEH